MNVVASPGISSELSLKPVRPSKHSNTQWLNSGAFNHQLFTTSPLCARNCSGAEQAMVGLSQGAWRTNGSQGFGVVPHCLRSRTSPSKSLEICSSSYWGPNRKFQ